LGIRGVCTDLKDRVIAPSQHREKRMTKGIFGDSRGVFVRSKKEFREFREAIRARTGHKRPRG
jgi:hypothetical protein